MAYKNDKQKMEVSEEEKRNIKVYAVITLILIGVALLFIIFPKGTLLQQCEGIILSINRDACLSNIAISTKNASICGMLSHEASVGCYATLGESTNNITTCEKAYLIDQARGAKCLLKVVSLTGNFSVCGGLVEPYKEKCFFDSALRLHDPQLCSLLSSNNATLCNSSIGINRAYFNTNISYCGSVSNSTNQNFLQQLITNTSSVFVTVAGNLSILVSEFAFVPNQNLSARDLCYITVAAKVGNSSYCNATGVSARNLCQILANQTAKNLTPESVNFTSMLQNCKNLTQYQSYCTTYVLLDEAVLTKNLSICASFSDYTSWQCYASIAKRYKNMSYCGYITNSSANSACLFSLNTNSTS